MRVILTGDFDLPELRVIAITLRAIEQRRRETTFFMMIEHPNMTFDESLNLVKLVYQATL